MLCGVAGFQVTDNLFRALQRLRHSDRTRLLWIDAICINQCDLDERSLQVQIMAEIYRTAWKLIVWVGDTEASPPENPGELDVDTYEFELTKFSETLETNRVALSDAVDNTTPLWWDRMWTVPELIAAGSDPGPEVAIGAVRLSWGEFMSAAYGRHFWPELQSLCILDISVGPSRSLIDMIEPTRSRDCKDKRDRVYSLLGIVKHEEAVLVAPDYSNTCTASMAYADGTAAVINGNRSLRALTFVDCERVRDPALPSWAIDFDSPRFYEFRSPYKRWEGDDPRAQKVWSSGGLATNESVAATRDSLHVRGNFFDRIESRFEVDCGLDLHDPESDVNAPLRKASSKLLQELPEILKHDAYCLLAHSHRRDPERSQFKCIPTCTGEPDVDRTVNITQDLQEERLAWRSALDFWYSAYSIPKPQANTSAIIRTMFETVRFTFFVTEAGFVGLGSSAVQVGDTVALCDGFEHALLLCPREGESSYTFHGLATVAGIMHGELAQRIPDLQLPMMDFDIR